MWIFALGRSFALRPGFIGESEIVVRFGLVFSLRIPKDCIKTVRREPIDGALRVPRNGTPSIYFEFTQPLEAERMLGFRRKVRIIGLCIDDGGAAQFTL